MPYDITVCRRTKRVFTGVPDPVTRKFLKNTRSFEDCSEEAARFKLLKWREAMGKELWGDHWDFIRSHGTATIFSKTQGASTVVTHNQTLRVHLNAIFKGDRKKQITIPYKTEVEINSASLAVARKRAHNCGMQLNLDPSMFPSLFGEEPAIPGL